MDKLIYYAKISVACIVFGSIGSALTYKIMKKPAPPPPEPIVVEWIVDKDFGDKETTLQNGLKLAVYREKDGTEIKWSWSVTGPASNETEAIQAAFRMGGVK